jgi:hypothetical protein
LALAVRRRLNRTSWLPFAPSKVSDPHRCRRDVTTATTRSHGVASLGVLFVRDHQGHRVPWLRSGVFRFRIALAALLRAPSPAPCETGSSSKTFAPLQSTSVACPPRRCSFGEAPSGGFPPSSRHQPGASTRLGVPRPRIRSVLGVSHALDGFLRSRPCGFISPRCRVQGSLFRGFPPGEAVPPRRWPLPSCRYRRSAAWQLPTRLR